MGSAGRPRWTPPRVVGVLNITEDSFSDGGLYLSPAAALDRAISLLDDGADIVDLGAIASNPDSRPVSIALEIERLDPVITTLQARGAAVSIDSFRPETQRYAIGRGVAFVNDIHGFPHADIYPELARAQCGLIAMHSVHGATHISRADHPVEHILDTIIRFFEGRLHRYAQAGIARERIILDPGMGYFLSANPAASFAALAGIGRLRQTFGLPVLVGVSRKSFLRTAIGRTSAADAGAATLAAELYAAMEGVDYIRTHDVAALCDGLRVFAALSSAPLSSADR